MKLDRVLIRDTDHLAHFASDLSASLKSRAYADVVLHCAPADPVIVGKSAGSFPTLRVHRAVLASVSDHLAQLLAPHPLEEDVHITLDATPTEALQRIIDFAYAGEVRIAKPLVATVCDAAHRLQIKFLKDSFVKITDKDYAAVKAGKKTLASLQQQKQKAKAGSVTVSTTGSPPIAPAIKKSGKKSKSSKKADGSKAGSDTDSAESDGEPGKTENKNKEAGKGGAAKANASKKDADSKDGSKKPSNVIFTLLKQVEDDSTKSVADGSGFLVHFKDKTNQENSVPAVVGPPRIVPIMQPGAAPLPSLPKNPLPPTALPHVKKVTIPPIMRKNIISLPKGLKPVPPSQLPAVTSAPPQQVINAFQLQTIRQPDGTEIQVLRQPGGGQIMKQIKSTKMGTTSTAPITVLKSPSLPSGKVVVSPSKVPSRLPPKDALAIAMEAIVGKQRPQKAAVVLPSNPIPVSEILNPSTSSMAAKPIPSAVVKSLNKRPPQVTVVHPPGYGTTVTGTAQQSSKKLTVVTKAQATGPPMPPGMTAVPPSLITPAILSARHSLSHPKPVIPSTVPDDFLQTEDNSSEGSKGGDDSGKDKDNKNEKVTANNSDVQPSSRISGRMRKVNRKYLDREGSEASDSSKVETPSSNAQKKKGDPKVKKQLPESSTTTPKASSNSSRKRKADTKEEEPKSAPPVKKKAIEQKKKQPSPPPAKTRSALPRNAKKEVVAKVKEAKQKPQQPSRSSRRGTSAGSSASGASGGDSASGTSSKRSTPARQAKKETAAESEAGRKRLRKRRALN